MTALAEPPTDRLTKLRTIGGIGAAMAVTPYLLIKIVWTFGLFVPTEEMGGADWRVINATTAFLAAVGITLALAFSRPWGKACPPGWWSCPCGWAPAYSFPCCCWRRCSDPPP